jgi:hypothetical protein
MALDWEDGIGCWVVRTTEVRCADLQVTIDKERCIEDEPHDVSDGSVLYSGSPVRLLGIWLRSDRSPIYILSPQTRSKPERYESWLVFKQGLTRISEVAT